MPARRPAPRPEGLAPKHSARFDDASVVSAYRHRPPYPAEVFEVLRSLARVASPCVLDLGCGTGNVARRLTAFAGRVDAIDPAARAVAEGRRLPGGDDPRLRWIVGRAEDAPIDPPYDLATAGSSLHWMDWDLVMPRLAGALAPGAVLAYFDEQQEEAAWDAEVRRLIPRYSTNQDYRAVDLEAELTSRGLFTVYGRRAIAPVPFEQSLDSYVESFHSRNGLSREAMGEARAEDFDREVRAAVAPSSRDGRVRVFLVSHLVWGIPRA